MADRLLHNKPEPIRVLLIDDDEDDFILTRDLFEEIPDRPFQIEWLADAERAVEAVCAGHHDIALIDYRLGRLTGPELIRRARGAGCSIPMILLTGLSERQLDFEAMQAGAADYLEKGTLTPAQLERAIRYTLLQARHADELERKVQERTGELARANAALQAEVAERARAEAALRDADRRKDEFLASLAHELRNPLVPIRFALEIMRLSAEKPELIEKNRQLIERQVKHMIRLIDDLMDVSRISRGKIQLKFQPSDLTRILEEAVEAARSQIEGQRHEFRVELPGEPIRLMADPVRLNQVVLNLLTNASKFTDPGGHIHLHARREGDQALITVADNGIGIPPDQLRYVFDMFAQIARDHETPQAGLGIGLGLVRNLVHLHGGTVEAVSPGPGQGTTFTIRIPTRPLADDAAPTVTEGLLNPQLTPTPPR
jgi:signal transduction histidine kinase